MPDADQNSSNPNSESAAKPDSPGSNESEQQPAWAPPQTSRNAYFDDQRTVYQRVTHEAQTSPEDDIDDVFSAPLEADDEHSTMQPEPQPELSGSENSKPPASSASSVDDTTTQLNPGEWRLAGQDGQRETLGPPGAGLSDLHDEGLGATMHGSQAFASFPAQEDPQETTMLTPGAGALPTYAQQYPELPDQNRPGQGQTYQSQPYGEQQGWDEQATYLQQPYAEQPFYPDLQQGYPAGMQTGPAYPPAYEAEQQAYPAGYTPQQTPFDPSHGAASRGTTSESAAGYPAHVEPQPDYRTSEPQQYPPAWPQPQPAGPQYAAPAYPGVEPHHFVPEQQYPEPAVSELSTMGQIDPQAPPRPMANPLDRIDAPPPLPTAGTPPMDLAAQQALYLAPQNVPGRFVPTAEEFAARRAHKPQAPEATMGLPGLVKRLTFGIFAPPMSKKEEEHREYVTMVRRNFGGLRQITVVNPKGGAGKTVASLMTAMTFGQNRGGYVLAWDNNETQGTLGMRAQPDFHAHTVRDVLQSLDTFLAASGKVGDLSSFVRSQGEAMFDVLASDESATAGEMLTAAAFKQIREVVSRFYKLIIVDTGNNVRAENWQAAIDQTDQLVVTMSARGDSAETAARMLDHLEQTGRSSLVRHAITVVSMPPSRRGLDLPAIERHFAARTRAVLIAPYELVIDSGEPIRYENISNASKEAWLRIASGIAEGL